MKRRYFTFFLCALALTACSSGSVKDTLGLNRSAPDEFRVVSRPPLSVPPQFNLRPPAAAGEVENPMAADKQAAALILGPSSSGRNHTFLLQPGNAETAVAPVSVTPADNKPARKNAESSFLARAGADNANPNIRQALEADRATAIQPIEEEEGWWETLSVLPPKKDPTVDAKKEAERIRQNKDEDKPVTEGETPQVKGRDTGVLGRILDY